MSNLPYQEKNNCASGDVVMSVTGEITAIFAPKQFDGKHGPFTIQNGYFTVDGDKLKFAIFGEPIPETLKGHEVTFKCGKLPKGGIGGVTYEVSNYDKKDGTHVTEENFKVDKHASILINGKEYLGGQVTSQPAKAVSTAPQASPSRPVAKGSPTLTQEEWLASTAKFHRKCFEEMQTVYPGMETTAPDMFQGFVSSLFITADRNGVRSFPEFQEPDDINF